ncbi:Uma2 family endonuclease [Streptomyces sp. RFCAC02]|uniref:Uma2 family endonuclease n=1 Tax=Streptomyces sp. RFCAC02 TaxID=2499143 RepID=UPI0010213CCE|nr:Uma2 family endonuclease [Streptomyces sp. RFCAC02]
MSESRDPIDALAAIERASPEPVRSEFLGGVPIVTPPADWEHNQIIGAVYMQFRAAGRGRAGFGTGFRVGAPEARTRALVIPDLHVLHREPTDLDRAYRRAHGGWYAADLLALAGEVTSSNHETDTGPKYRTYAAAGVPVYLLVHRARGFAYAFSEPVPEEKRYEVSVEVKLGEPLPLPAPYPVLDTSAFPVS